MYYEIEGTTVRLAGSVHLLPATAPNLPDWVWGAYQWAEAILFEHDASTAKEHVLLKDGGSLESHLPVPLWNKLVAAWPPDRPLAAISSLKPWMAIPTLPLSQFAAVAGVELQLTERARKDNKPVGYLETMAEFAELADAVPAATLHEALSLTLAELTNASRNFMDLHQAWLSRDLEQVGTVIARTPFHRMPEIAAPLIATRNERWLPKILAATASHKRTLIATGALHLPGNSGLLALLQRGGHRVRLIS
jgi:uncharacterized protein